jgi:hypothetical protein
MDAATGDAAFCTGAIAEVACASAAGAKRVAGGARCWEGPTNGSWSLAVTVKRTGRSDRSGAAWACAAAGRGGAGVIVLLVGRAMRPAAGCGTGVA